MVFETIHRPLFAESKQVNFPNNSPVSANYNGAFCKVGSISDKRKRDHSVTVYLLRSIFKNCLVRIVLLLLLLFSFFKFSVIIRWNVLCSLGILQLCKPWIRTSLSLLCFTCYVVQRCFPFLSPSLRQHSFLAVSRLTCASSEKILCGARLRRYNFPRTPQSHK